MTYNSVTGNSGVGHSVRDNGTVAIVGVGAMGGGVARLCLGAGLQVAVTDTSDASLAAGIRRLVAIDSAYAEQLTATSFESAVAGAGIVVDATPQHVNAKSRVLAAIADAAAPGAVIATITLATPLNRLDPARRVLGRLVGLHFMNPPHRLKFCEVVLREGQHPATLTAAESLLQSLQVRYIRVADTPGFVLNTAFVPFLLDAVRLLERGAASATDIDAAFTLGCGHPLGPLAILDLLGLDVALRMAEELHAAEGTGTRFAPPPLLSQMARTGDRFHPARVTSVSPADHAGADSTTRAY